MKALVAIIYPPLWCYQSLNVPGRLRTMTGLLCVRLRAIIFQLWRQVVSALKEMFTSLFPGYPRQSLACLHLFANLTSCLQRKLLPGMLERGGQIIFKWKKIFLVVWLVFKICSSVFQMGMCGHHAAQSSWNSWNSCMFLQKSAAVVF